MTAPLALSLIIVLISLVLILIESRFEVERVLVKVRRKK